MANRSRDSKGRFMSKEKEMWGELDAAKTVSRYYILAIVIVSLLIFLVAIVFGF